MSVVKSIWLVSMFKSLGLVPSTTKKKHPVTQRICTAHKSFILVQYFDLYACE